MDRPLPQKNGRPRSPGRHQLNLWSSKCAIIVNRMAQPSYATLQLSEHIGQRWPHIEAARSLSDQTLTELHQALHNLDSDDTSIVVLGSLGRKEFTSGSDIDWNLLVDGIADPNHHALFLDAQRVIKDRASKGVGREGTFEAFVSSHDLIHKIGGEDDTNRNLTRRLLLLLESTPVGGRVAYQRVSKNILKRYLLDDRSFWRGTTVHRHHIPHFLLNDLARFWRTMAVDFAYKLRARSGKGWAIRNVKLRMSRKLLYVAGLLGCFRCHLEWPEDERDALFGDEDLRLDVVNWVAEFVFSNTPLDIVANFLLRHKHLREAASRLFTSYHQFVGMLSDPDLRQHLDDLPESSADGDVPYGKARELGHHLRDALLELFFDETTGLAELTRLYGVF
jgi:hypothetical protein